ncbi:hypothetical protein PT974_04100 [Cladobotryum mycophilum]|uniref:GST N-terminal domain-containing protein n=1 Tax=Cladobotryum mycophilum TaxID=491253 RepID=A0ABR0SU35_9HYPO
MATVTYTVHHFRQSICSIMVRYCVAIRGNPKENSPEITFVEKHVDIIAAKDQLSEDFLLNVNPKGQVPALTSPSLPQSIIDSVKITHFLVDLFPDLAPASHRELILQLIDEIHSVNFFSLSFTKRPEIQYGIRDLIKGKMEEDISPRYRQALEYKLGINISEKINSLESEYVANMVEHTRKVVASFEQHLPAGAAWLFGFSQPGAADAHLVTLIARLTDVNRGHLVPPRLLAYAEAAYLTPAWESVMEGKRTMIA